MTLKPELMNAILSMDVYNVLDALWTADKLVCPAGFLLVCFYVL